MAHYGKTVRSVTAGLAGFLLTLVAWAQDGSVIDGPGAGAATIEVKGILISPRSRSALINGRLLRVGDQIGDVEIVAIDHREVRLRTGNREAGVPIGAVQSMSNLYWTSSEPEMIEPTQRQVATVVEAPQEPTPSKDLPRRHAVDPGETLSEIAEAYLVPGVRRYQLMVALFEANPHAFHGNINRMRAGVVLDIPDMESLTSLSLKTAMATVMEHTDRWRSEHPRQSTPIKAAVAKTYGPVTSGETLSGIAHRLSRNSSDPEALMSALYRENPHAFGENMNILREGAVLQIPGQFDIDNRPYEAATVVAQELQPGAGDRGIARPSLFVFGLESASLHGEPHSSVRLPGN